MIRPMLDNSFTTVRSRIPANRTVTIYARLCLVGSGIGEKPRNSRKQRTQFRAESLYSRIHVAGVIAADLA